MTKEISLTEEINIYINSGLTPTELFITRLLYLALDGDSSYLQNYVTNTSNGRQVLRSVLESLKIKEVINLSYKLPKEGGSLDIKAIPFNKNFLKKYIRESHELGKELFDAYPPFVNIKGRFFSLKNFTKANLFSLEDFCIFYAKSIKNAKVTHERVMDALEFGKNNNLVNYSIVEFIASLKYLEIEFIKQNGDINGYSNAELI
jgi:hypothetical protein